MTLTVQPQGKTQTEIGTVKGAATRIDPGQKGSVAPHHFPVDVQHLIFEIAARRDRKTALQLVLVARHVREWIDPILYECVVIRTQLEAELLLQTLRSKIYGPPGISNTDITNTSPLPSPTSPTFGSTTTIPETDQITTHSLALGPSITFQQAKPLLALCTSSLTSFTAWGASRNPSVFLPFLRSLFLHRLVLRATRGPAELSIPPALLSRLTHLVVLDGPYAWYQLRCAVHLVKNSNGGTSVSPTIAPVVLGPPAAAPVVEDTTSAIALFQSLTHFGTCAQNWGTTQGLLRVARGLKYFAVFVAPGAKAAPTIRQRIAELGDRRAVLVERALTLEGWEAGREWRSEEGVWEEVERLVGEGKFSGCVGDRWVDVDAGGRG